MKLRHASLLAGFLAAIFMTAMGSTASADEIGPISDTDRAAIRQTIEGQIETFRRDDEATAFSFAAPKIREMTRSPQAFMAMVRRGYAAVYRPRVFEFRNLALRDGVVIQEVFVVGPDGEAMTALYPMERQTDGSWLIDGCWLVRSPAESA